jgi:3-methyl-2-oxobutanoate hydroxymethyltransferase
MHDMLGLSDWTPSFVKAYAQVGVAVAQAARHFAEEVRERKFPDPEHSYR